jgi:cytochrome c-type biogenesis protein CcmH/NrfG
VYFEREFVADHRELFEELVARTQRIAFGLFAVTFTGYGAALWIWLSGNTWAALIIATLSYLFFRQFRWLSFGLARMPFRGSAKALPVLRRIEDALEEGRATEVMAELEAHLRALGPQDA